MSEGLRRLAATLQVDEARLAPLQEYDADRLRRLDELVSRALRREDEAFETGLEAALDLVPRPLRRTARKVLFPGGAS